MTRVLVVPGYDNSGPDHWQSRWEREHPEYQRVQMPDWANPQRDAWVDALDAAIRASDEPVVLVAHSLGCIAIAHWAVEYSKPDPNGDADATVQMNPAFPVQAALLVAPADVERISEMPVQSFAPVPLTPLPFQAVVVASQNDPYTSPERAREFAAGWLAVYVDAGDEGHINVASGHGPWLDGEHLLADLL
jgi:predicted alpha/beta hydrolase family esterase